MHVGRDSNSLDENGKEISQRMRKGQPHREYEKKTIYTNAEWHIASHIIEYEKRVAGGWDWKHREELSSTVTHLIE